MPPAFGICIALGGLAAFYGCVVFFFPARRFGLVAALALLWVAVNGVAGPRHRIRELAYPPVRPSPSDVHHVASDASGLMDDDAVLEGWFQAHGSRGPLVVVAADGGGVRAATWVMTVLTGLEQEIPAFPEQVRLVSGASGGMLAAAYYVASLQDPASGPHRHRNGRGQPLRPEDLRARVSQDSLTPLGKRLFLHDLVPGLSHLGHDRGDAIQLGRMFGDAGELRLATAVRMNATFPYVMPSLELPTSPSLRTVDAGYYDEHGVDLAARWLLSHADFIKARVSRVILIEIPDSLASVAKPGPCGEPRPWFRSGSSGLTTPVEAILSGRDAVSAYGNDELIEVLAGALNSADAPERFLSVAFEPPYAVTACAGCEQAEDAVPLSWYIKSKDARKLCEGMGSAENSRKLAALKQWWSR